MLAKIEEQKKARLLRQKGYSYSEIRKIISVSQASLSFWLKDVILDEKYISLLKKKKLDGQRKGALIRKRNRKNLEDLINRKAAEELDKISEKELWLLGIIAYWCEGAKQKINNVSQRVVFSNSDPFLIKLFLKWIKESCGIKEEDIIYNLHIHKNANIEESLKYWSKLINISDSRFGNTFLKKHNIKTVRYNTGDSYHGLMRITIRKSTNLNRKISGWILGINNNLD